jgi:hypothetical protein
LIVIRQQPAAFSRLDSHLLIACHQFLAGVKTLTGIAVLVFTWLLVNGTISLVYFLICEQKITVMPLPNVFACIL